MINCCCFYYLFLLFYIAIFGISIYLLFIIFVVYLFVFFFLLYWNSWSWSQIEYRKSDAVSLIKDQKLNRTDIRTNCLLILTRISSGAQLLYNKVRNEMQHCTFCLRKRCVLKLVKKNELLYKKTSPKTYSGTNSDHARHSRTSYVTSCYAVQYSS